MDWELKPHLGDNFNPTNCYLCDILWFCVPSTSFLELGVIISYPSSTPSFFGTMDVTCVVYLWALVGEWGVIRQVNDVLSLLVVCTWFLSGYSWEVESYSKFSPLLPM